MKRETHEMLSRLEKAGITPDDAQALRRIAMTLQRWHELECGDQYGMAVERDDDGKTYMYRPDTGARWRTPDRESGAGRRLAAIMAKYPHLQAYIQTDPRGAPLYILRPGDVPDGAEVMAYYNNGLPVYR